MTRETLITAVQKQQAKLINVLGAVQCIQMAVRHDPPIELEGAVELLGEEVQRVIDGLEALWSGASFDRPDPATSSGEEARP